jgi:hypothetical protein
MRDLDVDDTSQYCEALQTDFFASRALIIAANRGPMTFETAEDGSLQFQRGEGGRVQFLSPEASAYEGYYNVIANPLLWIMIPDTPQKNRAFSSYRLPRVSRLRLRT